MLHVHFFVCGYLLAAEAMSGASQLQRDDGDEPPTCGRCLRLAPITTILVFVLCVTLHIVTQFTTVPDTIACPYYVFYEGELPQLLAPVFFHASWIHLLFNMFSWYLVASQVILFSTRYCRFAIQCTHCTFFPPAPSPHIIFSFPDISAHLRRFQKVERQIGSIAAAGLVLMFALLIQSFYMLTFLVLYRYASLSNSLLLVST